MPGESIKMLRFTDDIAIMDESEQELRKQLRIMDEVLSKEHILRINVIKTKAMVCNKHGHSINITQWEKWRNLQSSPTISFRKITKDGKVREKF